MANPLATLARWFVPEPTEDDLRLRAALGDFPSMEQQIAALKSQFNSPRPYRPASISEALGVPSILSAVSLIANTVGTLSLEAFRRGVLLVEDEVPRIVTRPNPFTIPRDFFRDVAFYLATRGEAWLWVAARDIDDVALSLYPVPPWEVRVEPNERNRLFPRILWNDRPMPNADMRHITYLPSTDGLRGVGPLQLADAAVSVTVEADAWAANFFSGAMPSIIGRTDMDLDENDTKALDAQWLEKPSNMPRWLGGGIELEEPPYNAEKAQLADTRQFQVGEVARMFDMPGSLLEYSAAGSSLTYRNEEGIWSDFQRRCLNPHYLEPIEQTISDLLTRSTVAKFNTGQLLRSDVKTRFEVYKLGIESGVLSAEDAQRNEGLIPGSVDYAPVGPATPQATPSLLPFQRTAAGALEEVKCPGCKRIAGEFAGHYRTRCKRCGRMLEGETTLIRAAVAEPAAPDRTAEALVALAAREAPVMPSPHITVEQPAITVEAPQITVETPAVSVQPIIALPPETRTVQVMTPETVAQLEQLLALQSQQLSFAEDEAQARSEQLEERVQAQLEQLRAAATQPRSVTFERGPDGRIVRARQEVD